MFSMGKTTLLRHIAERKLAIPSVIDVLYCEQEVQADETPAVQVLLNADTKRLILLEQEKKLREQSEAGDDKASEQLREVRVYGCLHLIDKLQGKYQRNLSFYSITLDFQTRSDSAMFPLHTLN
jgi:ATP-binding cassette subfamily F protein 1